MTIIKKQAYVLRTCKADMTSHNGFVWPEKGFVECPDWEPTNECGNGLHGALWGEGEGALFRWEPDFVWQVVKIDEYIDLGGKVKFPCGRVVHTGNQKSATDYIIKKGAKGAVIGAFVAVGDYGTAIAGYGGSATAGYGGSATVGDHGTATVGIRGTAATGYRGTATVGIRGTATAGYGGIIQIKHFDGIRQRIKTAYIGEDGIKADTPYRLNERGEFVEVQQ